MDYWETNEGFTIVSPYAMEVPGMPEEKVNVQGGAMTIGHTPGVSGIRLIGTLSRILTKKKAKYGCATICRGGGQDISTILKN
ncbi:MAG: hypothetical protein JXA01_03235 [Dehalococcoidia bacterium]|nr:hypothetical protein [Dehalococcoidia bacterium]